LKATWGPSRNFQVADCGGFASSAAGNPLSAANERAKLKLVVDAARVIWG